MTCHHFDNLVQDSDLWVTLIEPDFYCSVQAPSKEIFKWQFNRKYIPLRRLPGCLDLRLVREKGLISTIKPQVPEPFYI